MKKMTEENLESAFAGESQAHMRYLIFAEEAEEEGFPSVARLFRAIAYAEQVHATNHYNILGMIRSSAENLQTAIEGENHEVDEMYPAYGAVAKLQEEKGALRVMDWALQAEKIHAGMYQKAKQAVESGKDIKLGPVYICKICGYTVEGQEPDRCPICGASKGKFQKF
ncbi:MAG: rubrerythrin family protein [Candidatus Bathyarchaeia archaeon]